VSQTIPAPLFEVFSMNADGGRAIIPRNKLASERTLAAMLHANSETPNA
jgi:hypothetical protein